MGYIHSLESFGTVDGPGVRFVVFFEGCPMRCQYCHNPDTWVLTDGKQMEADEIIDRFLRNASFYRTGGITATGGEPMLQIDFLTELFAKAKAHGIHTCLDTSGIMFPGFPEDGEATSDITLEKIDRLLDVTDLVMLDIKHIRDEDHRKLTGHSNKNILAFARYLDQKKKPVWIRHVLAPVPHRFSHIGQLPRHGKDIVVWLTGQFQMTFRINMLDIQQDQISILHQFFPFGIERFFCGKRICTGI